LTDQLRQCILTSAVVKTGDKTTEAAQLADAVASEDPAVGLRAVASLRALLEQLEALHVQSARDQGWSWQEIGSGLGVSKQAAHRKHGGGTSGARLVRLRRVRG
jgi:hypothetical protein